MQIRASPAQVSLAGSQEASSRIWGWAAAVMLTIAYLATLTPGHVFVNDDFAAYVMHAANLSQGRPYADTRYVPNPRALWLAPSSGYPPVYPAILAPVYKVGGMNLRAMKVATVICFAVFLAIFAELLRPDLSSPMSLSALLMIGLNYVFWEQRDYLLSEFPYLMFSFGALLVIQKVYQDLDAREIRLGVALLLTVLLYCAYGTRTIGIALLPALAMADFLRFKRFSRFAIAVLLATAALIVAQTIFVTSPKGYMSAADLSVATLWRNAVFYGKTLSYFWQNGLSKGVQIAFAVLFAALACGGFVRKLWREKGASEIYLLVYTAILCAWTAEIGLRGLLPVLPLYVAFGLMEFSRIANRIPSSARATITAALLLFVGVTYAAEGRSLRRQTPEPNITDQAAQQMVAYIKAHTDTSDLLIFPRPRVLALLTNRYTASLEPSESPGDSYVFMNNVRARYLVSPVWAPPAWSDFIAAYPTRITEVFQNSEFRMYEVQLTGNPPAAVSSSHEK